MFRIIQESTSGVVQTFGKFTRLVKPGLRVYIPFIQKITPVSNRLHQHNFKFEVKTKDNVFAYLDIAVQYQIKFEDTEKAFFSLSNPMQQIDSYIENDIRSYSSKMKLDDLFESQNEICENILNNLFAKMKKHGYTIVNTLITSIDPNNEVKNAMNKINATERLKAAAKNEADSHYIKEVRQAEADRDRKRLQGQGISEQRIAILKGYESGIDDMANNLGLTPKEIIEFVMKTQHLDTLEAIGKSNNTKTLFMNHDIGSISSQMIKANVATGKAEE